MSFLSAPNRTDAPLPGARPAGACDETDAARQVREMFSRIAPRYDFLNPLLSLELDRLWRWRVARRFRRVLERPEARVLDLCCGTGDLTFALHRAGNARIYGSDFAHPMLARARQKARSSPSDSRRERAPLFAEADSLQLPFPGATFDLVTTAFGFRNLASYERGLLEIARVLRPGGEAAILEFTEPEGALLAPLYRFYFTRVLPRIGRAVSGDDLAYSYLPSSVARFPRAEELAAVMSRAGLSDVRFELWTFGAIALHMGRRAC